MVVDGKLYLYENKYCNGIPVHMNTKPAIVVVLLVALMSLVTGEDGTPEWQPKKVFFTSE